MIVTRFAPSPTGYLHLGHALAAFVASDAAQTPGGRFLLRIEDIDRTRARDVYEHAIYEDLGWLGLTWPSPVMRQSERFCAYRSVLDRLEAEELLYPCFCTRSDIAAEIARSGIAPQGPDGVLYPGTCRRLSMSDRKARIAAGDAYALRLDSGRSAGRTGALFFEERGRGPDGERGVILVDPYASGDFVVARKGMPASYHLAVVVDDAEQGVTLVTRGNDLFSAAHPQRILQALLGLPAPAYAHHRLILDEQGHKLSKRDGATSLRSLREHGASLADIKALLEGNGSPDRKAPRKS